MLILTRKCISKTRVFLCPVHLLSKSISASASPTAPPPYPSFSEAALPFAPHQNSNWEIRQAVPPFKVWFQTARKPLLDRIFEILSSRDEEDLSSVRCADSALAGLGFRLSEAFVLDVLTYGTDVLSCLKFFDWAGRQHGFNHTRATFHSIFKILSRAKLMPLMLEFLNAFKSQKYVYKARFYDTLVIGYAVAGKPELALELLGRMRFQGLDLDPLAYNVLLNGLVEGEFFDIVDSILNQMKMRGHVNEVTHTIVLKSFCKQNQFDQAEEYFRQLLSTEEVVDGYMLKVIVDALCKMNRFEDADRLVSELRELGCIPMNQAYDVWVRGLVRSGKPAVALGFLNELKVREGYVPEVFRYNMLLFRLLKENRLREVFDLLTEMREHKVVPDSATMNAVLCFFCKAGMVDVSLELYHLRSEFGLTPNSMAYNYLVNSLCRYGNIDEAFHILKSSVEQGTFCGKKTLWMLADALYREKKFDKMKWLLVLALEHNFNPNDFLYNKLISALLQAKRVEDGYSLHGELNRLNVVTTGRTYSHMISEFNELNRGDIAARLLIEMQEKGHEPTCKLIRTVVQCLLNMEHVEVEQRFFQLLEMQLQFARQENSCCIYNLFIDAAGRVRRPDLARRVFEMMIGNGVDRNLNSDILMLQSYLKNERIADALSFFDEVSKRREIKRKMYHAMVVGLCRANRAEHALEKMREIRKKRLVPTLMCYEEIIRLLCAERQYDKAVQVFNDMEKCPRHFSSFIGNVFLLHSRKSRDLYDAWIRSRDYSHETSSSMMLGELIGTFSCEFRSVFRAEQLEEAVQRCYPLDVYTYNILLKRLSTDQIDEAFKLFVRMRGKGYKPNVWTYDALAQGFFIHGRKDEGMRWVDEMFQLGFHPSSCTKSFF